MLFLLFLGAALSTKGHTYEDVAPSHTWKWENSPSVELKFDEFVALYRKMSLEEYSSILRNQGNLSCPEAFSAEKWFTLSRRKANQFENKLQGETKDQAKLRKQREVVVEFLIPEEKFNTFFNGKAIGQYDSVEKLKEAGYRLPVWHREGLDKEDSKKNHVNLMVRRELLDDFNRIVARHSVVWNAMTNKKKDDPTNEIYNNDIPEHWSHWKENKQLLSYAASEIPDIQECWNSMANADALERIKKKASENFTRSPMSRILEGMIRDDLEIEDLQKDNMSTTASSMDGVDFLVDVAEHDNFLV